MTFSFTTGQLLALFSAIIVISGGVNVVVNAITKISAPNKLQNARLDAIELKLEKHDELFMRDLRRFESIENGNRVTQRAILALLSHGIDGSDISALKDAKNELEKYLIER